MASAAILVGLLALHLVTAGSGGGILPTRAASPTPESASGVTMTAEAMLDGNVTFGSWAAFRVNLHNSGPAVEGELRVAQPSPQASAYGVHVQLPPGARQEHFLYAPAAIFGGRYTIIFARGPIVHARANVALPVDQQPAGAYVVAERPQSLVAPLRDALVEQGEQPPIVSITPEELPHRVEAWSAVDLLVWHDVDAGRLQPAQLEALHTWVLLGGDLLVLAGSRGASAVSAFPAQLLPFQPRDAELSVGELEAILGAVPATATPVTALTGLLQRGEALALTGDSVLAARATVGPGTVTLVGLDPTTAWLAESPAGRQWWARVFPAGAASDDPRLPADDTFLTDALATLPAVQLPRSDHLFVLIVLYVIAIGPVNYFVLRRRDRREWAWLTMPLTIAGFAIAAYVFGVVLKGSNVVVNQLAVVQAAPGADRGLADVHVGIYSPARASFDISIAGNALLSVPLSNFDNQPGRPLDVVQGDPAVVRGYQVGFGALRAFRAHAAVDTPLIEAGLHLVDGSLGGDVTNASGIDLEHVSVVYGGSAAPLGALGPGQSRAVDLLPAPRNPVVDLADQLFPAAMAVDAEEARRFSARRAVIRHLRGGWAGEMGPPDGSILASPAILAWVRHPVLGIDVGTAAEQLGETLYVLPARVALAGPVVFGGGLMRASVVSIDAMEGFDEGGSFWLSGGTITVDYRPPAFDGEFVAGGLAIRLGEGIGQSPAATGDALPPLPAGEQPDPEAPLASDPRAGERPREQPRLQLFDRVAGTWIEFEPLARSRTYTIAEPGRYVDLTGTLRVRFVVGPDEVAGFSLGVRLEGSVE